MSIKIEIEQTTFPGEMGSKVDFAVTITTGVSKFEFDLPESKSFLSHSVHEIFETLRDCDPQALHSIAENHKPGSAIILNGEVLNDPDVQDVMDICETTRGMEF